MDPDSIRNLIHRLVGGTRSGKLSWEETADENAFRLLLESGIIHVRRASDRHAGDDMFQLVFLNQNNTVVEIFDGVSKVDQNAVRELYELARNSALKPTELLERLDQEVLRRSG